jgi:hypothetical protein
MIGDASFHRWRHAQRLVDPPKLYHVQQSATAAAWSSTVLLNAFVRRVKRRIDIRLVRFWCRPRL